MRPSWLAYSGASASIGMERNVSGCPRGVHPVVQAHPVVAHTGLVNKSQCATSSQPPGGIETAHKANHARCALDINARTS